MLKKIFTTIVFLTLIKSDVFAEGVWNINGYQVSNVHIFEQSEVITLGGRISGPPASGIGITVSGSSDKGKERSLYVVLNQYTGRSELFEKSERSGGIAGLWRINSVHVDAWGMQTTSKKTPTARRKIEIDETITPTRPTTFKVFENSKQKKVENPSKVLFTSGKVVNIIVENRESKKVELVKNIEPNKFEEIEMKKGNYKAKIMGTNISKEMNFSVKYPKETIILD